MSEDQKQEVLDVVEETDGSASVELPDNIENPQAQDADSDADHPDDTDAQREARRNRRRAKKDYIKRTNEEKDSRLTNLQRQNQELMERLAVVERKSYASDLARLDKAMEDEELRLNYATAKMREATDSANGAAFTQAQQMWYESKRKIEAMEQFKQRAVSAGDREEGAANPQLVRQANKWMERNSWYDPKGGDEDSQIAKVIDNKLAEEGYDPASSDYWEELDSRLQKRLPHLYNQRSSESNRSRPRSVVTGTGRETGRASGGNTFVLEPEQVRAMKDAGLWDDPEKRARMIKRYAAEAKLNRNA
ncbi:MAG: hypothetical protein ACOYNN_15420 [Terrimicrobiaceae bacterium]